MQQWITGGGRGGGLDCEGLLLVHCALTDARYKRKGEGASQERGRSGKGEWRGERPQKGEGPTSCQVINRCDGLSKWERANHREAICR